MAADLMKTIQKIGDEIVSRQRDRVAGFVKEEIVI